MKPKNLARNLFGNSAALTAVIVASFALPAANAATLSWDGADATYDASLGGTGTWNTSLLNWGNGAADVAWTDTTGLTDIASFGGTAGTVTLGTNVGAKGLVFGTAGYTVTGSTLTLGTSGIDASALSSGTTTISSGLTLASGNQTWKVGTGSTLALSTGTFTRSAGATLLIDKSTNTGTVSASNITNTNGIVGPWAAIKNSGTAANVSSNGYTYATVSGGNLVAYTGATSMTGTGAWGGIASGGTGTVNYDISSNGALGATGALRTVNTLRYTGSGARQMGNNAGDLLSANGIMNSGTGALTIGKSGANITNDYSFGILVGATRDLVLAPMTADLTLYSFIKNNAGGASAVTIVGNNTVNLASGSNAYTGATTITGGTLLVSGAGSINTSSGISINGSNAKYLHTSSVASTRAITLTQGTLDGTGTVGAVTVGNGGGIVANGNGASTALTLGSLSFGGASTVSVNTTGSAGIVITGALSTTPASGQITLNAANANGWTNGSTYNLIGYGSFSGSLSDFTKGTITGLSSRQNSSLVTSGSNIALSVAGDSPYWTGGQSANWTTSAVGGSSNWQLVTAGTTTEYLAADAVLFNDSASGNFAVNVAENVSPSSVTFDNSTNNYTLASSGGFGIAAGSLTKNGSGTVTITTANTFSGATTIGGGTLQIGDGTTDGSIASTSSIANNGTLAYNLTGSQSYGNVISGTGSVTKSGAGALTLSGANTYSGGTTVNAGSLQISVSAAPGAAATGAINLAGGTSLVLNSTANNYNYAPTVTVNGSSTTLSKIGSTQTNFTGTINGNGNALDVNTSAGRLYINGTTTNGVSQFNVTSGAMGFDLAVGNNQGGGAAVNVSSGASLYFANAVSSLANNITLNGGAGQGNVGALYQEGNAAPTISGSLTLASGNSSIGGSNAGANVSVTGAISGSGALTKIGANTYSLSNAANSYSGGTTIAAGALAANNDAALGSGAVSISNVSGAQLQLGSNVNVSNALTINGGGVAVQGVVYVPTLNANATYSGDIAVNGVQQSGGLFAANGGTLTLSGAITSSVPVTVRTGTVLMSNTSSSYSALTIQAGTVRIGANNAIPVGATADLGISGVASLDLGGFNQTLTGLTKNLNAATVTNSGTSDSTLTTTGTSSFGGVIQNGATNKIGLTVGGGALTLTGVNTYTGATNINAGTLALASTGTIGNTSGVSLGTAGTFDVSAITGGYSVSQLTGSGNVTGALSVSTTLAIGNSPGTVNFSSDLTLLAGSTYSYEVTGSSSTVGANTADLGIVNGNLTIDTGAVLDLIQLGTFTENDKFTLFAYTGTLTGTFSGHNDDTMFWAADGLWLINYNDTTAGLNGGTTAGASYITATAVPEPAALLLGSLGVLTLLRRRRVG